MQHEAQKWWCLCRRCCATYVTTRVALIPRVTRRTVQNHVARHGCAHKVYRDGQWHARDKAEPGADNLYAALRIVSQSGLLPGKLNHFDSTPCTWTHVCLGTSVILA